MSAAYFLLRFLKFIPNLGTFHSQAGNISFPTWEQSKTLFLLFRRDVERLIVVFQGLWHPTLDLLDTGGI